MKKTVEIERNNKFQNQYQHQQCIYLVCIIIVVIYLQ